jgi:hypothetical protein
MVVRHDVGFLLARHLEEPDDAASCRHGEHSAVQARHDVVVQGLAAAEEREQLKEILL